MTLLRVTRTLALSFVALAALNACSGGGHDTVSITGPGGGPTPLGWTFTRDATVLLTQAYQPSPLVVGGFVYLYISGGSTSVLRSADGLNFTSVPAGYPGGSSRSFVTLPDGRFRMYFFTIPLVQSAVSTNGVNWTPESGSRISLNQFAVPKVVSVPAGGYRMYYGSGTGPILSAFSTDGLSFVTEPGDRLTANTSFNWGDPAVIYTGSEWLMLATDLPANASFSSIWLARSADGLNWTLDSKALITESTGSPIDASFLPVAGGYRIYYGINLGAAAGSSTAPTEIHTGVIRHG